MVGEEKKTALVLSGGGSRGAYEVGVWQALKEMNIKIDIVTGTSAGAINGAVIVQDIFETAYEIWKTLETEMVFDFSDALRKGGGSYTDFKETLSRELDEQAIRISKVDFGIVTVEFPSMEPKHLWKEDIPEGKLLDYILASASCFPAVQSYEIDDSRYIDGGYSDNLPVGMAMEKGATHVIAVNLDAVGVTRRAELDEIEHLKMIQCHWDLGNFLLFDKDNSRRIMRLGYLDAMKIFGAYDGELYCFIKGQMDKRHLAGAEQAAAIFELDPEVIYSKEIFLESLERALNEHEGREAKEIADTEENLSQSISEKGLFGNAFVKGGLSGLNGFFTNLTKLPRKNSKTLLLLLARHLKDVDIKRSLLLSKPALALFSKEISAAYYLVRAGLV